MASLLDAVPGLIADGWKRVEPASREPEAALFKVSASELGETIYSLRLTENDVFLLTQVRMATGDGGTVAGWTQVSAPVWQRALSFLSAVLSSVPEPVVQEPPRLSVVPEADIEPR